MNNESIFKEGDNNTKIRYIIAYDREFRLSSYSNDRV